MASVLFALLFAPTFAPLVSTSGAFQLLFSRQLFATICLREMSRDLGTDAAKECTFGVARVNNRKEAQIAFTFRWTNAFSLVVTLDDTKRHFLTESLATPSNEWTTRPLTPDLSLSFRVKCDPNYHSNDCAVFCRSRDDTFGHYSCSANGTKECAVGWSGASCDAPLCDCFNGFCESPNKCVCRHGWRGDRCDQCQPYPGCRHGFCVAPFQCNCDRNWGGILCDHNLDVCASVAHLCLNGGQCVNTAPDAYRCHCPDGFSGLHCQTIVDACALRPCLHSGLCHAHNASHFHCSCA
ncbi:unnamed protein product, partial [Medioppia subpectinata]